MSDDWRYIKHWTEVVVRKIDAGPHQRATVLLKGLNYRSRLTPVDAECAEGISGYTWAAMEALFRDLAQTDPEQVSADRLRQMLIVIAAYADCALLRDNPTQGPILPNTPPGRLR